MSYISFEKLQLINLDFSLSRELLRSNRAGGYSSTTIAGCNTRKYHGLLVVPQPWLDSDNHVLLSSVDETVIQRNESFNLAVRMYPNGVHEPKGHKYLRSFTASPIPRLVYRVGGVVLSKEMLFAESDSRLLIKYTLEEANSPTILRLKPFLAFRNVYRLSKANIDLNNKFEAVQNGVSWQMYKGYSRLYMQFSRQAEYTHVPDWYYNIEYIREKERGNECNEDLFVPGFFDINLKKGESIILAAGLEEKSTSGLTRQFVSESKKRIPRDTFENCLSNSAQQFIVRGKNKTEIMAGFPWFGTWGRDTFIALPGLTLLNNDTPTFKAVINTNLASLKGSLFPNIGRNNQPDYASVDAPLWFFWAMQQYSLHSGLKAEVWNDYGRKMKQILEGLKRGTEFDIYMDEQGLLHAGTTGMALTWMDVVTNGKPVTPRNGYAVEVNALWYNAICFALELASAAQDNDFIKDWRSLPDQIRVSFAETFWDEKQGYLADCVQHGQRDMSVRPNMLFAVALPHSPINDEMQSAVMKRVRSELLTSRGLRTLSPMSPLYKGQFGGNREQRHAAYHQGTVFTWLTSHYAEAWLKLYGKSGLQHIQDLYEGFESVMFEAGIGSISEVYEGDPPHLPGGAISQAWAVADLIRLKTIITRYQLMK
jgi:predicted glycogen debranching enzyme